MLIKNKKNRIYATPAVKGLNALVCYFVDSFARLFVPHIVSLLIKYHVVVGLYHVSVYTYHTYRYALPLTFSLPYMTEISVVIRQ